MEILRTERLRLRTMESADAPFYLELINQDCWMRNIGDKGIRTLDFARSAIERGPMAMQRRHGYSLYVVERRGDGAALGLCGLNLRDALPCADIGYALMPAFWGRGYSFEAAAAVLAHARAALGLARVLGVTAPDNLASNNLLRKLGLQFERYIQLAPGAPHASLYACDFAPR